LRWRRDGWSTISRYRTRGRWRGGRPRVSSEIRHLIAQMARENFLWGAPRIHGELLMLGFTVSQATVSRYLRSLGRRPIESWRTFVRNQALAFGQYSEQREEGYERPQGESSRVTLIRPAAAEIARACRGLRRVLCSQPTLIVRKIRPRAALCGRAAMHRVHRPAAISTRFQKVRSNRLPTALAARSPVQSSGITKTKIAGDPVGCFSRGSGFDKPHESFDRRPAA
jgi:hypothetical protein